MKYKGTRGNLAAGSDRNVHYLDCGDVFTGVYYVKTQTVHFKYAVYCMSIMPE